MHTIRDLRISTNCRACTNKCCSQPYDWVYLTHSEIAALERASGKLAQQFTADRSNEATGAAFTVLNLPCTFLDAHGRCSVYESRPLVCRLFPFYADPLTGHAALLPAQCGPHLNFHGAAEQEGWQLSDYDLETTIWLRDLWREAFKQSE